MAGLDYHLRKTVQGARGGGIGWAKVRVAEKNKLRVGIKNKVREQQYFPEGIDSDAAYTCEYSSYSLRAEKNDYGIPLLDNESIAFQALKKGP